LLAFSRDSMICGAKATRGSSRGLIHSCIGAVAAHHMKHVVDAAMGCEDGRVRYRERERQVVRITHSRVPQVNMQRTPPSPPPHLLPCLLPQLLLLLLIPPAVAHQPVTEAHHWVAGTPGTHLLTGAVSAAASESESSAAASVQQQGPRLQVLLRGTTLMGRGSVAMLGASAYSVR
jgi:hypothetical protein